MKIVFCSVIAMKGVFRSRFTLTLQALMDADNILTTEQRMP